MIIHLVVRINEHFGLYNVFYKKANILSFKSIHELLSNTSYLGEESLRFFLTNLSPRHIPKGVVTLKALFDVVRDKGTISVLSFDFDRIPLNKSKDFLELFLNATSLSLSQVAVVHTGNGLHIYVPVTDRLEIESFSYLQERYYSIIYKRIGSGMHLSQEQFDDKGLKHWSAMGRVPLTSNTKKIDGEIKTTKVYVLNVPSAPEISWGKLYSILMCTDINIQQVVESRKIKTIARNKAGVYSREDWKDTPLKGCDLIQYCLTNPNDVSEPMWFDVIRILKEDPHGEKLVHKISERYDGYDAEETDKKYKLASKYTPPTCAQMHKDYNRCHTCKHYNSKFIFRPTHLFSQTKWAIVINNKFRKITNKGVLSEQLDVNLLGIYLVDFFGDGLRVSNSRQELYVFKDIHWEMVSREELMARYIVLLSGIVVDNIDNVKREVYSALCLVTQKLTPEQEGGDSNKYYFNNGIYDVMSGKWTEHNANNSTTSFLNYSYGLEDNPAGRQTFSEYLRGLLYDEDEDENIGLGRECLLQEHIGNIFSRRIPDGNNRCLFIYGPSNNGKSKFFNIIRYILGDKNVWPLDVRYMDEKSMAEMSERYLALDADYSASYDNKRIREDANFKKVVTGDPIMSRRPYCRPEHQIVRAKLVVLSNAYLTSVDKSEGFYKRFSLLNFPNTFYPGGLGDEPDVDKRILKECRNTIFSWAMEGYRRLKSNGFVFSLGPDDKTMKEAARRDNDPVYYFMREKLIYSKDADYIQSENIYRLFIAWQAQEGLSFRITKQRLIHRLGQLISAHWPKKKGGYYGRYHKGAYKSYYGFKYIEII